MIALIVRRQEIDTMNLAISCKVNIQAPIPYIVGLFWMQPVLLYQIHGSFWVRLASKTTLTGQNLCKKRFQTQVPQDDKGILSLMGIDKLLNSSFLSPG